MAPTVCVKRHTDIRPLTCEPDAGKRTELNVLKSCPRHHWSASKTFDAFVQMPPTWLLDVWKQIFVKGLKKIIDDMRPHKKFAIQRFEENLTKRGGPKNIFFISPLSRYEEQTKLVKWVQSLFLKSVR